MPPNSRVVEASAWRIPRTGGRCSSVMPMPVSATAKATHGTPSRRADHTQVTLPALVNLQALLSRLSSTWRGRMRRHDLPSRRGVERQPVGGARRAAASPHHLLEQRLDATPPG